MRYILAVIVVALTIPAAAAARTPASVVALVTPVAADVRCATSWSEWYQIIDSTKLPFGTYYGFMWPGKIRFAPWVCTFLNGTNPENRGRALNIIAHEATHLTGNMNEPYAACRGLYWAPILTKLVFGVRYRTALMRRYVAGSRAVHLSLSPLYRTGPGACA